VTRPILEVSNLGAWIDTAGGTLRAVDDVSFVVHGGETYSLLGESGCGKSMTALALMRLLPDAGRIASGGVRLDGQDLLALTEARMREVRGQQMAMIFQEPATSLNPVLSVGTQIGEVLARHAGLRGDARPRAAQLLDSVGIPDAERRLQEFPFQFSGGMKQRVMIAMALAGEPKLLIADEPTTALDVTIQAQVLDLLAAVQESRGMGMLLITHDLGVVARMAHRVGVMYAGRLIEEAPREPFFRAACHPYTHKLFAALPRADRRGVQLETIPGTVPPLTRRFAGCRFVERCAHAFERCRGEEPAWHALSADHRVRCHLYDPAARRPLSALAPGAAAAGTEARQAQALLEVRALKVHFPVRKGLLKRVHGHVRAVDGIDLTLAAGRTLALVGESGCGKTTAGKAILRLIEPNAGAVVFDGEDLVLRSRAAMRPLRRSLQMIFQDPFASLNPRMRVGDIIEEGMAALAAAVHAADRQRQVAALLRRVGLDADMAGRYPHEFSGGQRQRIAIARALAVNPRLLVCDEPTSALDVSVQAQILNLLKELQQGLGLSYLFITHNIAVVDYLAHEVAVMYLGRIVESGAVEEILRAPKHPYTEALLAAVPAVDAEFGQRTIRLKGDIPSPSNPPTGCHFHPRCPDATERCRQQAPELRDVGEGYWVACWLHAA
jgi:peptide/nickel transport system ATP-binding protein